MRRERETCFVEMESLPTILVNFLWILMLSIEETKFRWDTWWSLEIFWFFFLSSLPLTSRHFLSFLFAVCGMLICSAVVDARMESQDK